MHNKETWIYFSDWESDIQRAGNISLIATQSIIHRK